MTQYILRILGLAKQYRNSTAVNNVNMKIKNLVIKINSEIKVFVEDSFLIINITVIIN